MRYGSLSPPPAPSSTPVSIMRPSNSHTSIAHSMLNLSISPSSSSSSSTTNNNTTTNNNIPFTSTSTPSPNGMWPVSPPSSGGKTRDPKLFMDQLPSPPNSNNSSVRYESNTEWKTSGTIPSLMGKIIYIFTSRNILSFSYSSYRSTFKTYICYFGCRLYSHSLSYLSFNSTTKSIASHFATSCNLSIAFIFIFLFLCLSVSPYYTIYSPNTLFLYISILLVSPTFCCKFFLSPINCKIKKSKNKHNCWVFAYFCCSNATPSCRRYTRTHRNSHRSVVILTPGEFYISQIIERVSSSTSDRDRERESNARMSYRSRGAILRRSVVKHK